MIHLNNDVQVSCLKKY